jgi:hypothetical protein
VLTNSVYTGCAGDQTDWPWSFLGTLLASGTVPVDLVDTECGQWYGTCRPGRY